MSQEFKRKKNQEEDMLDILINATDTRTKLEKDLDFIAQELKDNLQDVIANALDATLYIDVQSREPIGFDIGITTGSPDIRLIYNRGVCQLRGSWGSISDKKGIDNEICETILMKLAKRY